MIIDFSKYLNRVLDVDPSSLSVTADSLRAAVAADRAAGITPLFVLATVGTTSTSKSSVRQPSRPSA